MKTESISMTSEKESEGGEWGGVGALGKREHGEGEGVAQRGRGRWDVEWGDGGEGWRPPTPATLLCPFLLISPLPPSIPCTLHPPLFVIFFSEVIQIHWMVCKFCVTCLRGLTKKLSNYFRHQQTQFLVPKI